MEAFIARLKSWAWLWTVVLAAGCAQAGTVRELRNTGPDSAQNPDRDARTDDPSEGGTSPDAAADSGDPSGSDGGSDADAEEDAAVDGSPDAGDDAGMDAGDDAGMDTDAGIDAGMDADVEMDAGTDAAGEDASTSDCVSGTYAGMFEGTLAFFGIPLFNISGDIVIEALTSDTGNELRIENGRIEGADEDGNPVEADVNGIMDCTSYKLRDGTLTNGTYVRTAFGMTVNFDGVVQATYSPGPMPSVAGTWEADAGAESGKGTFSATLEEAAP